MRGYLGGLLILLAVLIPPRLQGQTSTGFGLRQNLDLPFEANTDSEEEEEDGPEVIVFYGQQFEGDGIFYCCDKSGSMREGTKFLRLQEEVIKNIQQFTERVEFAIVFFDSNVVKFPASGRPVVASPATKAAAMGMVRNCEPGSGTCIKAALVVSLQFAHQAQAKRKVIICLSDGFTNCPGHDALQYGQETLAEVSRINIQRVHINVVCIGGPGQANERWMRTLAAQNEGSFTRIIQ